jgi:hypothetical protein
MTTDHDSNKRQLKVTVTNTEITDFTKKKLTRLFIGYVLQWLKSVVIS